ncbi:MAG: glycerophosphodiester phosphodiesterase [Bacteroidales bacterium]|nr:glycerophosphodiester phosphodiesterase [Bacteroidales bacterium]
MKKALIIAAALLAIVSFSASAKGPKHKVAIVAHRGYWDCELGQHATNSIASLKACQKLGFWGSEFDVNMTSDEVLLVFHDGKIDGKRIDQNPYSEFKDRTIENGEKIPTLDEYLTQAEKSPKTKLVFEIKKASTPEHERRCTELCIKALKAHGLFDPKKVIFISFSLNVCKQLVKSAPGFTVQYLDTDIRPDEIASYGINGVDTEYKALLEDQKWYTEARSHGMSINTWTVNKPDKIKAIILLGVDQLTTNNPEGTRAALKELKIKEQKATRK